MTGKAATSITDLSSPPIDCRRHPEAYRIGRGEQGVLTVEPYKSDLLPHWRFRTPELAEQSSRKLLEMFRAYLQASDFVGADMARKFLQMGWTRARRYANHKSGRKYDGHVPADQKGRSGAHGRSVLPRDEDPRKAEAAAIFYRRYAEARSDPLYLQLKKAHAARHQAASKPGRRTA